MQCEEFEIRLNEALDRRLPLTAAEALDHQRVCPACRQRAAAYMAVARELARASSPAPPDELTQRVLAELRHPVALPLPRRRRPALALAAAAAVLVSLVGAWAIIGKGFFAAAPKQPVARRNDASPAGRPHAASREVQAADARLASPPAASANQSVAQAKLAESNDSIVSALPDAANLPGAEWAQHVADGLQPVTRPTLGAATGFLQVWGLGEKRPRSAQGPRS